MNNYKKINNIFGWLSFVAAFAVYALTMEPTSSFWDCGEFISASYGLQVVHPPGAPLFLIIGRFFSLFAGDNLQMVAPLVNMVSVLSSAFCVMFTFWITTYFGRKLVQKTVAQPGMGHTIAIMGAGLVAALTLTFSDTFWFSAVEAEVYAASSFFTAITFWAILKWEENADDPTSDKWLVFIGYLIGLAIGVHLLNLLVIPAIVYVYYFRRYNGKITRKGLILAGLLGGVILVFVQLGVIPGIPSIAAKFDLFFVNSLKTGFGVGAIFFMALLMAATVYGIIYTRRRGKVFFNTMLLCFSFIIIGYSSYTMVLIRSRANPPIDMNNPDDPFNLVYYLNREQYGDRPLLRGPYFTVKREDYTFEEKSKRYRRMDNKYAVIGQNYKFVYKDKDQIFFPRIYDHNDASHAQGYRLWSGMSETQKPKYKNNIKFFIDYQMNWMYFRYFMWNFSGRQNDEQGMIGLVNGNWISGIPFVDEARLGPQANIPEDYTKNRGRNKYYMLPFILGIIGLIFHIKNARGDSFILGILFLITGAVLIIYLNPPPFEPRERDYVFVGSFQVFCTWVGLAVLALVTWLSRRISPMAAAGAATVVCLLAAPVLMASQNWDDHDRSNRYMTIDFAKDYLNSCPKNAILFTNGDNDTYPLWYAQNVEKYRTDVRVINYSLLGDGEYANGLRNAAYESAPIKLSFSVDQCLIDKYQHIPYIPGSRNHNPDTYYELKDMMAFAASTNEANMYLNNNVNPPEYIPYIPAKKFKITVDMNKYIANGWVAANDTINRVNELTFDLPGNALYKNGLLLLDIIANNSADRPICFTTTTGNDVYMGLTDYFEMRGLVYRLVPFKTPSTSQNTHGRVNTDTLNKLLVETYAWGGMEKYPMYVDDKAKLVPYNVRNHFGRLAEALVAEGKNEKAIAAIDHCLKSIPNDNYPYTDNMVYLVDLYYAAGAKEKGRSLMNALIKSAKERFEYFGAFKGSKAKDIGVSEEKRYALGALQNCASIANKYGEKQVVDELQKYIQQFPNTNQ